MDAPELFPFKKRNWYPHMMPADVTIWERFIDTYPDAYDSVEYDVKVGTVPGFVTEHPDEIMRAQAVLYNKKIDVVGHNAGFISIIELKPRASMSTIGQVKGYLTLYKRDIKNTNDIQAIIITDALMPDMETLTKLESVKLIVV